VCMVLAERFPVPVEGMDAGGVTLGFVLAVTATVLFGWQAGVLIAAGGPAVTQLLGRREPLRVAFNGSMFALSALGGGLAIALYQRSTFKAMRAMRLALTDPLTGVGNHRRFHERLQRELAKAEQTGETLGLCLIDVDDFKHVNDRFGHPAGDCVLSEVAARLRQGGDSFRLGGDEFAILLPGLDEDAALQVAQSLVR